jgi:chloramphenicol O-acetyltransferase type B
MAGNQGHRNDWISTFPFAYVPDAPEFSNANNAFQPAGDTVIGNDVWIGSEAIIMPGVTIGHGAVIGARALVTKNVEPYTIVGGNPAKPIRKRFADEDIALLLQMAWWDWPVDALSEAMPLLTSGNIKGLFDFHKSR